VLYGDTETRQRPATGDDPDVPDQPDPGGGAREALASVARAACAQTGDGGVLQVVHGAKRVGWAAYELQRSATEQVRGVVKPPCASTSALDALEMRKLAEGVDHQVLYDRGALAHPSRLEMTSRLVEAGEQARVLHLAPTKLVLVDGELALLPLVTTSSAVESAVVVRNCALLAAIRQIFEDMWRLAAPFTAAHGTQDAVQPSEEERWILSLLASGATDDAIGRLMGFSARTAHRRVRELIARLGVQTRFQAGMQAVRLGWL
jgi:DNA-binding NarL/FixJ family response regulator